jgi:hypothetical protein
MGPVEAPKDERFLAAKSGEDNADGESGSRKKRSGEPSAQAEKRAADEYGQGCDIEGR